MPRHASTCRWPIASRSPGRWAGWATIGPCRCWRVAASRRLSAQGAGAGGVGKPRFASGRPRSASVAQVGGAFAIQAAAGAAARAARSGRWLRAGHRASGRRSRTRRRPRWCLRRSTTRAHREICRRSLPLGPTDVGTPRRWPDWRRSATRPRGGNCWRSWPTTATHWRPMRPRRRAWPPTPTLLAPLATLVQSRNNQIAMASLVALRRFLSGVRSSPRGLAAVNRDASDRDDADQDDECFRRLRKYRRPRCAALAESLASLVVDAYVEADLRGEALAVARLLGGERHCRVVVGVGRPGGTGGHATSGDGASRTSSGECQKALIKTEEAPGSAGGSPHIGDVVPRQSRGLSKSDSGEAPLRCAAADCTLPVARCGRWSRF